MSLLNEIKCPHCGQWHQSTGVVEARCTNCGEYLDPERVVYHEQKQAADVQRGNYYMVISDKDETITQIFKIFINTGRWFAYYAVMLFFVFVTGLVVLFGLLVI